MRIVRLYGENYSRLADFDISVRGHLVAVGANNVGKTSLLRILQALFGASVGQLYQLLGPDDLRDPTRPLTIEAVLTEFADAERTLFYREISIAPGDAGETLTVRLEVHLDEDPSTVIFRRWFPESGNDRPPSREQQEAFGWRYLPATRGTGALLLDGPNSAMRVLLDGIDLGEEKEALLGSLNTFNAMLGDSPRLQDLREKIAAHFSRAMPRSVQPGDLAVRSGANSASALEIVSMYFQQDGTFVPLADQSDGMRQLTAMTLFDLAEGSANIVAIDEPEMHLHPTSQRTAADLFTNDRNQKILATHSPFVMQRFEPAQVVAIRPDGAVHQLPEATLTAVDKLRVRWWSPRLLEALSARAVILVEGEADRLLVEAVERALGIGLDRLGVVVFQIDGADKFPHVFKFLGPQGFDVHVVGLVDADAQAKWTNAFGGKPSTVLGHRIWVSDPDLEGEYCTALGGPQVARILIDAGVCRDQALLQPAGVTCLEEITPEAVAAYCRKNKVEAAIAIADVLTAESAALIKAVADLLDAVRTQAMP